MNTLTLVPAYGRDYKSKAAVLAAWNADKDFLVTGLGGSGYINKSDLPAGVGVSIRYKKLTAVLFLNAKQAKG